MQALVQDVDQRPHVGGAAQLAHLRQALLDQQVVVVLGGVVLLPGVVAFELVELQSDFPPGRIVRRLIQVCETELDLFAGHRGCWR